ncbi:MAG: alpha/beta fold hydrolase [Candidatus Vogelbacteria bacterium]|nr:alpha/beta fold hydrolase [Candidatus Vogelbacteria bacterium]
MKIIKTRSFRLAINTKGSENSGRVAVVLPGRLDTKDYSCFNCHLEYLAEKNHLAVSFDPPGTWESPGGIELFTTTNYIKAVNELVEYFGNRPTILLGHSRGGTVSIIAGTSNPSVVGYVAIMSSYGAPSKPNQEDVEMGFRISYRDLPPGVEKTKEQRRFDLPIKYFIDGEKYDAALSLVKSTKPKLLFYGTRDEFTGVEEAEEVFKKVSEPKIVYKLDTDHDYRYHPEIVGEISGVIGEFLIKYFR